MSGNKLIVEQFDKNKSYKGLKQFDCGFSVINAYVKDNLKKTGQRDNAVIKVLIDETDCVLGFFSAVGYVLTKEIVPSELFSFALPKSVSVVKIPMIAIVKKYKEEPFQGQGWGQELMREVFIHTLTLVEVARDIKGIYLDAAPHIIDFYKKYGFVSLKTPASEDRIQPMFMSIDTLKQIFN